jgi:asparagine synthase (glutamine-hydrolysing)
MCGIVGKLNFDGAPISRPLMRAMCDAITHRGPDDFGIHIKGPIGIGSRRLSIIDLAGGHQPISNEDETIWIVFNGEIYNFPELRKSLVQKGHVFSTNADTEVIVHLYEEHDIECLQYLNGMFAFAIWDENRQRLFLARDRLGKKPLVYSLSNRSLVFSSEFVSLLQDSEIPRQIDLQAIDLYLALLYIPSPWTIFKAVRKLSPGHYLTWERGQIEIKRYWDMYFAPHNDHTEANAADEIRDLLEDSVRRRLISDVPLGAFLSGGIDSSVIVAFMAYLKREPVRTFSIAFGNDIWGELPYAREVARRYETDHYELVVQPKMVDVLPLLVRHYGEPFGDSSAVATYYISQVASQSVKVVLSGDGGDEVFGGYPWYVHAGRNGKLAQAYIQDGLRAFHTGWRNRQLRPMLGAVKGTAIGLGTTVKGWRNPRYAFERLITFFSPAQRQQLLMPDICKALRSEYSANNVIRDAFDHQKGDSFINQMFYTDHHLYLPNDILVKIDIASMANSLEVRSPFLDYRLVELSASLPPHLKVNGTVTKHILRRAIADLVPNNVLNRPKRGFGLPVDQWMRKDLYSMARDLLLDNQAHCRNLFQIQIVQTMLERHRAGQVNYGSHLWALLFFELWCRNFLDDVHGVELSQANVGAAA